jgi:hypothetical protein
MPHHPTAISLYKVTLITAMFSWLLDSTGALARLPRIELFGDGGFWVLHTGLFAAVWLLIAYLERLFGVGSLLRAMRSNHGTAAFLDVLILVSAAVTWAAAFGAGTLSLYHIALLAVLVAAAFQSLAAGREPSRVLAPTAPAAPAAVITELPVLPGALPAPPVDPDAPTELLTPPADAGPLPAPDEAAAAAPVPPDPPAAATVRLEQP